MDQLNVPVHSRNFINGGFDLVVPGEAGIAGHVQAADVLPLALRHGAIGFQQVADVRTTRAGGRAAA